MRQYTIVWEKNQSSVLNNNIIILVEWSFDINPFSVFENQWLILNQWSNQSIHKINDTFGVLLMTHFRYLISMLTYITHKVSDLIWSTMTSRPSGEASMKCLTKLSSIDKEYFENTESH